GRRPSRQAMLSRGAPQFIRAQLPARHRSPDGRQFGPLRQAEVSGPLLAVNAGARLDRLPISSFHRRILTLIGIGMFFDGFDVYVPATVLGATLKTGFATLNQNALFVSVTFLGMRLGAFLTGSHAARYVRAL